MRLADFEGAWRLTRRIEDRILGQTGHLDGRAWFTRGMDGLNYSESGTLRLPGQPGMQAERRYLWREAGAHIEVLFDDGRPFHAFDLADSQPAADHWCEPDSYAVRYDFAAWPDWTSEWQVIGPRKDYTLHSAYRRDPSG